MVKSNDIECVFFSFLGKDSAMINYISLQRATLFANHRVRPSHP